MDVVLIAAGDDGRDLVPSDVVSARRTVAADSGYDLAVRLGLGVDVLVGDLDSISAAGLAHARAHGVDVIAAPRDKDLTDLELAIDAAVDDDTDRLVVLGGRGGRLDHQLAVVAILAGSRLAGIEVEAWMGGSVLFVVRGRWTASLEPGDPLSIVAWEGDPSIRTAGLRWPLVGEVLGRGTGRGVSNEALGGDVCVEVADGVALVIVENGEALT